MDLVYKDCFVYAEICKGLYSLKQAACNAFDRIVKLLNPPGYYPLRYNPGSWCRETLPKHFALCVNYFGIKYTNPVHAHHIVGTLQKYYKISIYWEGKNHCRLTLDWNYNKNIF